MGTFTMTTGFGMLAVGLIVIGSMATIFFLITRKMERDKKEEEQRKQMEKIYGSR